MYFWFPKLLVTIFGLGAKIEQGGEKKQLPPPLERKNQGPS